MSLHCLPKETSDPWLSIKYQIKTHENRLHRIKRNGEAFKEGVLVNTKQKESAKPSRNLLSGKPKLRHH